ncbi:MAG: DUF898 family protein, partial [Cellvibrionales bacterium]|nr:DUF898 family protein [Cellvibrionales bacterium]
MTVDKSSFYRSEPRPAKKKLHKSSVTFTGRPAEFFVLFYSNLALSILTLGIYSAWAKVKTKKYFYHHLSIDDHHFEYHATPSMILKGRCIAMLVFVLYSILIEILPLPGLIEMCVFFLVLPWMIIKSFQFNHQMTSLGHVRFDFNDKILPAIMA